MRRSAANAELTRQVEKSTPAAYERVSKDDAHLGFFHSSLSRRSSLRHRARIIWLVPEPSRTRGLISALVLRPFLFPPWLRPSVFYLFLRRYGRRSGQPSSSSLARRACVHFDFVWVRVFIEYMAIVALKFASTPGPFGGRGDTPRWGLMAGAAACCAQFFRCSPFSFPSGRPQPRGGGGDATSRQDTRQDC